MEIFGHARLKCGIKQVEIELPAESDTSDLARALRGAAPALAGVAVEDDGRGLTPSYTANVNGVSFMGDSAVRVADGDRIFVFSSQAGG